MDPKTPHGVTYSKLDHIVNKEGVYLFCKTWKPKEEPRALVFIAHGASEHCLRYKCLGEFLADKGYVVISHDHVGHGQSQGDRVHIDDMDFFADDVIQHIEDVNKDYGNLPVFIFGHSLGGLITALVCLKRPSLVKGVILSGAAIGISADSFNWFTLNLFRTVAYLWPQFPLMSLSSDLICRDKDIVEEYKIDPFVYHGSLKARLISSVSVAQSYIAENMNSFLTPVLILHGEKDQLIPVKGSQLFADKLKIEDKTLKIYEGCYHELHNEPDGVKENVMQLTSNWIENRL